MNHLLENYKPQAIPLQQPQSQLNVKVAFTLSRIEKLVSDYIQYDDRDKSSEWLYV